MKQTAVLSVLLAAGAAAAQDHFDIFIITGQSNARPKYADGVLDAITASGVYEHPVRYNRRHSGNRLMEWVDGYSGTYSLEDNFLEDFWSPDDDTDLQILINRLDALGISWDIAGFFWFQGEADSGSPHQRTAYTGRFFNLLNALEIKFGLDHDIPFIITAIDYNGDDAELASIGRTPEDIEAMRQVQFNIGQSVPYGATYDSRGWPRLDLWHVGSHDDPRGIYGPVYDLGVEEARMFLDLPKLAGRADLDGNGARDLNDLQLFLAWVRRHDPRADFAAPLDVYDLADVQAFIEAFVSGG